MIALGKTAATLILLTSAAQAQAPPVPLQQDANPHDGLLIQLLDVKRVYIDKFSGGENAAQLRDMIIASLQRARLFIITENPDRADVVLRGSGEDLIYTDQFQSGEGISARVNAGGSSGSGRTREALNLGASVGQNEQTRIQERKHEASASVRLVNKDGDVLWSTTQESGGGKFRGASADVADKITRQLVQDLEQARAIRNRVK